MTPTSPVDDDGMAERDLPEHDARSRRLVGSNIIGIAIWHADGRILDINDAFLRLIGYDREDFASGRVRWSDFVAPEWHEHDAQALLDIRSGRVAQPHEKEYIHKSGARVPVLAGGALFDESPDEGVAFTLDLTGLKRTEEAARDSDRRFHETQMRLTDANGVASIGQLAASIAHEINQPLSGIVTNASTCLRMLAAEPPQLADLAEAARRMIRDANRASDVVARLRALFARKATAFTAVDLNAIVRDLMANAASGLHRHRVNLRYELAEDLPPVIGDAVQLQQVISNLVRNASDAMLDVDDRSRELVIRTSTEAPEFVRLDVQDAGIGLDAALLEKPFEPFYSTKPDGMGVGLSVSRSIIESHQGRLWAALNDGPGATFSFCLPRARG